MVHMNKRDREEHIYTAFQYFDQDSSGYITEEEMEQALQELKLYGPRNTSMPSLKLIFTMWGSFIKFRCKQGVMRFSCKVYKDT
ncbi:hypothetical protein CFC21_016684 [Triticum aestivum]|uniref:EF-hand domain-containing protein n=3 Tax=Triticum TaxID=4564 RepID=A0A9R1R6D3_TRITD|nr:hypothetical protein CFC21_016684 [Triticum aestivum]VAH29961.1 unnamed protein product [Triticum turgidum subsp. durum]